MKRIDALQEKVMAQICMCFQAGVDFDELTAGEVEGIMEEPYYLHIVAGEDWHECPEWAQERTEMLDEIIMDNEKDKS